MKTQLYIYAVLVAFFAMACNSDEAALKPSNTDEDRVATQIDLNNPTIANLYATYNSGVLYQYDNILDFAYVASTSGEAARWEGIEIPELKTLFTDTLGIMAAEDVPAYNAYVEQAVTFIDTTLFKYFKPNTRIAGLMPYKVLLSESVFSDSEVTGESGSVLVESESRYSSKATSALRAVYNANSIVFAVNQDEVAKDIDEYTKDNFYILLCRIMGMHDLYNEVPDSFFEGKSTYYGQNMEAPYKAYMNWGDEKTVYVIDKDWFYSLGFIDATYFYASSGLRTYYQSYDEDGNRLPTRITHLKALRPTYSFVAGKAVDVRSYINEMIHRNESELLAFPENIQANLVILRDLLTTWGVDIVSINPALEAL